MSWNVSGSVRPVSFSARWLVPLLCMVLSCDSRPGPEDTAAVNLGRRQDWVVASDSREAAVAEWRASPTEDSALELLRAYFPEPTDAPDVPSSPVPWGERALRVKLPSTEAGTVELATRGHVFRLRARDASEAPVSRFGASSTSSGARHGWAMVGSQARGWDGTQGVVRADEYQVLEGGQGAWKALYEVTVPPGITTVRDADGHLEFLDARGTPVLRMHYPLVADAAGHVRQGEARVWGLEPGSSYACGGLPCHALAGPRLRVEVSLGLEGLSGPAALTMGWSSTGSLATGRYRHTTTLLPNGKVLVAGGYGTKALSSTEVYDPANGTWSSSGSLDTGRDAHTATLLPNGKVLVVGGYQSSYRDVGKVYDPASGTWSSTSSMATSRHSHTATLLPSGKVLVVGGINTYTLAGAELYDPATNTWKSVGPLYLSRSNHTATLLPSGKVLVVGGYNSNYNTLTATAEEYDPATETWSRGASLSAARRLHTATLLPNGKVLVAGGQNGVELSSVEVYDPASYSWNSTGSLSQGRSGHTAVLLPNGRVLVMGGAGTLSSTSMELYNPTSGTWSSAGSLSSPGRNSSTATLLPNGRVLVVGGVSYSGLSSAEVIDPPTGTWPSTSPLASPRSGATATLLPNGKALVTGGRDATGPLSGAQLHDPATGSWSTTASLAMARSHHTATLLPNGKVLVTGGTGADNAPLTSAELYDPATNTWSATAPLATARSLHTATLLSNGKVLVAGGRDSSATPLVSTELYDPVSGSWSAGANLSAARHTHTATPLFNGRVLVAGGYTAGGTPLANAELYDPVSKSWSTVGTLLGARAAHSAVLLPNGQVLVSGGQNASAPLSSAELYDPNTSTWSTTGNLAGARFEHSSTLLVGGQVLVTGGRNATGPLSSAELYDPTSRAWRTAASMTGARASHVAVLLPGGKVLVAGGQGASGPLSSAELYDGSGAPDTSRPTLTTTPLSAGTFILGGTRLTGVSEASSGNHQSSPTNFPMVELRPLEGAGPLTLPALSFSSTSATVDLPALPGGYYLLTVTTHAISGGKVVYVQPDVTPPAAPVMTVPATGARLNTARPLFSGTAEASSTVAVSIDGQLAGTAITTSSGTWSFTPTTSLGEGSHTATATASDLSGNTSPVSATSSFTVDTLEPAAPVLATPTSGALLNTHKPTFSGSAEARSTVAVYLDNTPLGTATADASGAWSFVPASGLTDGIHTATARATDLAGNTGPASAPVSFTLDTVAPAAPVVTAPANGASTRYPRPTLSGTAEALSSVTVFLDGVQMGTVTANGSGTWSFSLPVDLSEGPHTLGVQATDAASNTGPQASSTFTVDTTAPAAAVVTAPVNGALLNTPTPTVSGIAEPSSTVTVFIDGTSVGSTLTNGSGIWSRPLTTALNQGSHTLVANITDAAGNAGPASNSISFSVDSLAPAAPVVKTPVCGTVLNHGTPAFSGTAEPHSTVTVFLNGSPMAIVTAHGAGAWSYTPTTALADASYVLTVSARDAAGNTSPTSASCPFSVDTAAPAAPVVTSPASGAALNTSRPTVSGSAEAHGNVSLFIDGKPAGSTKASASGSWSLAISLTLGDGEHSLTTTATDAAGNTSQASVARAFTVDTVAPTAPLVKAPTSGALLNTSRPTLSGTAEPRSLVSVFIDGSSAGSATADALGAWSLTSTQGLGNGTHTLVAIARDAAGNDSPASESISFTVDATPPAAPTVTAPASGAFLKDPLPTFTGSAEASSTVSVFIDGRLSGTVTASTSGSWSFTPSSPLADRTYSLTVQATDGAGNTSQTSPARTFTVDTVPPPTPVIQTPTGGKVVGPTASILGTAEPSSTVTLFLDGVKLGTASASSSGEWSFSPGTGMPEGTRTLTATATDKAGNVSQSPATVSFTVDATPPQPPVITAPVEGALINTSTPRISGTAEPSTRVLVLSDGWQLGETLVDGSGNWSFTPNSAPLYEGRRRLTAIAVDPAENSSQPSTTRAITVDTLAPVSPEVTAPADGAFLNDPLPTFTGYAEDSSTVSVFLDGRLSGTVTASTSGSWSFTPSSPLADRTYSLTVQATDSAGNTSQASPARTFTVDGPPPTPTVSQPVSGATITARYTFTGFAEASSQVWLVVDEKPLGMVIATSSGVWSFVPSTGLADGAHTLKVIATDQAGNASPYSAPISFTVDGTPPAAPLITAPLSGARVGARPLISGTAEPFSLIEVVIDDTAAGSATCDATGKWSLISSGTLSEGSHSLTATATDMAGNVSQASAARTFVVDAVPPSAPVVTAPTSGALFNTPWPTFSGLAEPNSSITLLIDGQPVGTTTASSSGTWSHTPTEALAEGTRVLTVTATDMAGNTSRPSAARTFTVDTLAPEAPVITSPGVGALVNTGTPSVSGTAEPSSIVALSVDGMAVGQVSASTTGAWSFTFTTRLSDGSHTVTATARDGAGNTSPASDARFFTVDTQAPAVPVVMEPTIGARLRTRTPTLEGTAEAGSRVSVMLDSGTVLSTHANASGVWSLTTEALSEGPHEVKARATDAAGNPSAWSTVISFFVETQAPTGPVTPAVSASAASPTGATTVPTFEGTAGPGTLVRVLVDGEVLTTVRASDSGTWSFTPSTPLSEGTHTMRAVAVDEEGNTLATSSEVSFTVHPPAGSSNPPDANPPDASSPGTGYGCTSTSANAWGWWGLALVWLWKPNRRGSARRTG
ncbi:Ig-like domain-containing protein [Archangium lipolyticum]|uniref:Ig-like domain-containing protein n=1 Tax=Archangium lipolyticum TaxID=2970465 RepID=UPI00214A0C38|nr:Ig-like domain-containing protein [Archangium lipolyticum]